MTIFIRMLQLQNLYLSEIYTQYNVIFKMFYSICFMYDLYLYMIIYALYIKFTFIKK